MLCLPLTALLAGCALFQSATVNGQGTGSQSPLPPPRGFFVGRIDFPAVFDYVIVGAGPAGLTLAARLAQNNTVALIEAGGFPDNDNGIFENVPAVVLEYVGKNPAMQNPLVDWEQRTTPQPGFGGISPLYTQGKTLGGSASRHALFFTRGSKGTYDKWADAVGDQSYTLENLLPFFKKSIQFTPPNNATRLKNATTLFDENDFSTTGGPLQVAYSNYVSPAATFVEQALIGLGFKNKPGLVDGDLLGYSYSMQTIDPVLQARSGPYEAFLPLAESAGPNFALYTQTLAKKILFDEQKNAVAVEVQTGTLFSGSVTYNINATKEVIVSAGAMRSPQLLMVSGVGPSATLKQNDIDVIADRPGVGQNLWDQIWTGVTSATDLISHEAILDPALMAEQLAEYEATRTGIFTNTGNDIVAFEKLPSNLLSPTTRKSLDDTFGPDWPDIEFIQSDAFVSTFADLLAPPVPFTNYTAVAIALVAPFSRGNITIASNDTLDHPVVNPAWLTDPRDQEVAVAMIKRARQVMATKAMQSIVVGEEVSPGVGVQSDEQILEFLMGHSSPIFHVAGSNKMGMRNDPMAVVDSRCFVIGVNNLRVVDASAFPLLPPGHPQSTVYALAEKIAVDILEGNAPPPPPPPASSSSSVHTSTSSSIHTSSTHPASASTPSPSHPTPPCKYNCY